MAKVKPEIIEAAIVKLIDNITSTMPNTTYKFILGGAAGMLGISNLEKLKSMILTFQDEHGLIDTDKIRATYDAAFKAAGGKLSIELFNKPESLLTLFVKPLTLTISKQDIDELMNDVESNSVVTEVSISK